jgi:hypothetical protein
MQNADFIVARYNEDGTLDVEFGSNGIELIDMADNEDQCQGIAIQNDGKIVAGGYAKAPDSSGLWTRDFAVTRLWP